MATDTEQREPTQSEMVGELPKYLTEIGYLDREIEGMKDILDGWQIVNGTEDDYADNEEYRLRILEEERNRQVLFQTLKRWADVIKPGVSEQLEHLVNAGIMGGAEMLDLLGRAIRTTTKTVQSEDPPGEMG